MQHVIPSLTSLKCFQATYEQGHVTKAALALNMTQSAVTRQIQKLEYHIGVALFRRVKRRLEPTEAGKRYLLVVAETLGKLEAETLAIMMHKAGGRTLHLRMYPTFGARWLMPKLGEFTEKHTDLHLDITTGYTPVDFTQENVDISIQHGLGDWPNVTAIPLMHEDVIAVCAPAVMKNNTANSNDYTKLHMRSRPYAWDEWHQSQSIDAITTKNGPTFENYNMMLEALYIGMGVAIVPQMFVGNDLASGALIAPFGGAIRSERAYYIAFESRATQPRKIKAFTNWIQSHSQL